MDELTEALKPFFDQLHQQEQALQAALAPILEVYRRQEEALRAVVPLIEEEVRRQEEARPGVVSYLLDRGWYITFEFPTFLFTHLHDLIGSGNHDGVDAAMSELARQQLEGTEKELLQRFPDRAQIFADAFEAHRTRKYTLSIPAFLSQVDGVGCEILGIPRHFFKSKHRTAALERKLSAFVLFGEPYHHGGVLSQMLDPLTAETSLGADTDRRDEWQTVTPSFGPLNRHGVLHGIDTDYATEVNSLRCVLLLRYLLDVDQILQKEIPEQVAELNAIWQGASAEEPS